MIKVNRERLGKVISNMKSLGMKQILVADDHQLNYLIGRKINPFERCGCILIKDTGKMDAFMNNLFCMDDIEGCTMHYYADGENVYKMIADELEPGRVGFDDRWMSKHSISVLNERDDIQPINGSLPTHITATIQHRCLRMETVCSSTYGLR